MNAFLAKYLRNLSHPLQSVLQISYQLQSKTGFM